jgi:hypothetical protein
MPKEFNPFQTDPQVKKVENIGQVIKTWQKPREKETIVFMTPDPKMFTRKIFYDASNVKKFEYHKSKGAAGEFILIDKKYLDPKKIIK